MTALILPLKVPLAPVTLLTVILGEPVRFCAKATVPAEVRYVLESTEPSAFRNCDEVPPAVEYPTHS